MLHFLSLGSGSSGNCYVLWTEHGGILIDVGLGIRMLKRYAQTYDLQIEHLQGILLTHDHADHVKSIGKLTNAHHVPVYTTKEVFSGIGKNGSLSPKVEEVSRRYIEKDVPFSIGDFNVTAFHVPHDSVDCVGYRIEVEDTCFTIITDAGHVTERIQEEVGRANYLVLESNHDKEMLHAGAYPAYLKGRIAGPLGHLSNVETGNLLANYATPDLRHVWLCHLSEENNHPELARKTITSILNAMGIVVGKDFEVEVLRRKMPTGVYDLFTKEANHSSALDNSTCSNIFSPGSGS